jgi:hypothetical protein
MAKLLLLPPLSSFDFDFLDELFFSFLLLDFFFFELFFLLVP